MSEKVDSDCSSLSETRDPEHDVGENVITLQSLYERRQQLLEKKRLILTNSKTKFLHSTNSKTTSDLPVGSNLITPEDLILSNCETLLVDNSLAQKLASPSPELFVSPNVDNTLVQNPLLHPSILSIGNEDPFTITESHVISFESPVNKDSDSINFSANEANILDDDIGAEIVQDFYADGLGKDLDLIPLPAIPETPDATRSCGNDVSRNEFRESLDWFPERDLEDECSQEGRKRKRIPNKETWKKNQNKKKRMLGQQYIGFKKVENKYIQNELKPPRSLGKACDSQMCLKSKVLHCEKFTETIRKDIFDEFWKMSWTEKKVYVCSMVDIKAPMTRKSSSRSRRSITKVYCLKLDNIKQRVCLRTFLGTLGIKEWTVRYWLGERPHEKLSQTSVPSSSNEVKSQAPMRDFIRKFLSDLPKLPSHYCRMNSMKSYLEPMIQSKRELYRIYVQCAKDKAQHVASRKLFEDVLSAENVSIYKPKKDQCDVCCAYKVGNIEYQEYSSHVAKKNAARSQKEKDKDRAKKGEIHAITADLQAVKLCPYLQASSLYFKTKLTVHNFTIYNLGNDQVRCYWFDETASDLKASTYASFFIDYLTKLLRESSKDIVIFTDGCTSQNRNVVLSNALLRLAMENNVIITHKYLEKGHTQMEVDSVHSVIERKLKNKEIFLPSQYAAITKEARLKPSPYEVILIDHTFFRDYSIKQNFIYDSIRPGREVGAKCVTDIRLLQYKPEGTIEFKINYEDELEPLPRRPRKIPAAIELSLLYSEPVPISESKYNHLQQLKQVIPQDCHTFYDKLPFKTK